MEDEKISSSKNYKLHKNYIKLQEPLKQIKSSPVISSQVKIYKVMQKATWSKRKIKSQFSHQ